MNNSLTGTGNIKNGNRISVPTASSIIKDAEEAAITIKKGNGNRTNLPGNGNVNTKKIANELNQKLKLFSPGGLNKRSIGPARFNPGENYKGKMNRHGELINAKEPKNNTRRSKGPNNTNGYPASGRGAEILPGNVFASGEGLF